MEDTEFKVGDYVKHVDTGAIVKLVARVTSSHNREGFKTYPFYGSIAYCSISYLTLYTVKVPGCRTALWRILHGDTYQESDKSEKTA